MGPKLSQSAFVKNVFGKVPNYFRKPDNSDNIKRVGKIKF